MYDRLIKTSSGCPMPNPSPPQEKIIKHHKIWLTPAVPLRIRCHWHRTLSINVIYRLQFQKHGGCVLDVCQIRRRTRVLIRTGTFTSIKSIRTLRIHWTSWSQRQNGTFQLSSHIRQRGKIHLQHPQNSSVLRWLALVPGRRWVQVDRD